MGVKTDGDMFSEPVNPEVALAKGVELFWSFFLYSFLIVVSFVEYWKYAKDAELKKIKDELEKKQMQKDIKEMKEKNLNLERKFVVLEERLDKEVALIERFERLGVISTKKVLDN